MFKKDYRELSVRKHVLAWWVGTPVALLVLFALPAAFFENEQRGVTATAALWAVMVGVFIGPFLGLVAWLMNRGLHNIAAGFRAMAESNRAAMYEARAKAAAEAQEALAFQQAMDAEFSPEANQTLPQGDDPWHGTNPYGCCQHNYDEHGVLHHGSPDCRHPEIVAH